MGLKSKKSAQFIMLVLVSYLSMVGSDGPMREDNKSIIIFFIHIIRLSLFSYEYLSIAGKKGKYSILKKAIE